MSTYMVLRKEERRMRETFLEGALAGAGRLMLHEVTELKARPELEHAGDPKWERPSLPTRSSPSGRR